MTNEREAELVRGPERKHKPLTITELEEDTARRLWWCDKPGGGGLMHKILAELDAERAAHAETREKLEQKEVQLAGCGVAALGGTKDPATRDQWGWSPAYQDVLDLRISHDALQREVEALRKDKERLDWMEQRKYACFGIYMDNGAWAKQIETEGYAECGRTLREAIDRAAFPKEAGNA
jgi:hypothetical protein